jgi:pilus assembly protein CpaB
MDVKKVVLLVGALIVAAVTAVMAKNMFAGAGAPQAQATPMVKAGPEVLVATKSLPVGTIIDAEALRYQPWPEGLIQPAYYTKDNGADPASLIGTVVRTEITAGQPITQGALVKPGERGFLAAALGPGMRAVTVAVTATSGVAGFVFPGDRVDLVLSQEVAGGGDGPPLKVAETILRNVRVLAIDQSLDSKDENGNAVAKTVSSVTLEATPKMAEKIAVAQKIGEMSLSLRSIADNASELEQAIASGEVSVPANGDAKAERKMIASIAGRPSDSGTTQTVGSDVSRYQRSTVPAKPATQQSAPATGAPAAAGAEAPPKPKGPVVRVSRGNNVTEVAVGVK